MSAVPSTGSVPVPTATPSSATVAPMSVVSFGPSNQLVITGTVVALLSNGFQMEAGSGVGYYNVYTSSSTRAR